MEVWRILDHAVANDAGETDANGGDLFSSRDFVDLLADAIDDAFRGHGLQRVQRLWFFRKDAERTDDLVTFHEAYGDMFHYKYANCPAHGAPTHSGKSKIPSIDSSLVSCSSVLPMNEISGMV